MFSPKRDETRPGYEMRKEHIAIGVMILLCLPILAIYVTFFAQAFVGGRRALAFELPLPVYNYRLGSVHRSDDGPGFSQYGGFHPLRNSVRSGHQPDGGLRALTHALYGQQTFCRSCS